MNLSTVLSWVSAGGALVSEGVQLYNELKTLFSTEDQVVLEAAYQQSIKNADAHHQHMQGRSE